MGGIMEKTTITLNKEREVKNSIRYKEVSGNYNTPFSIVYINKSFLGVTPPESIKITLE